MASNRLDFSEKSSYGASVHGDVSHISIKEPFEVLTVLKERYKRKKNMYRETKQYYNMANLLVFFLPLIMAQSLTTLLSSLGERQDIKIKSELKAIIAALNGVMSIWTASQLKFGWAEKARAASTLMMKYRDISWQVDLQETLLKSYSFREKSCVKEAVANVLKESYQQEMRDCASKDVIVPFFIYRKHKKGAMEEAAKLTVAFAEDNSSEDPGTDEVDKKPPPEKVNLDGIIKPRMNFLQTPIFAEHLKVREVLGKLNIRFWRLKNMYRQTSGVYFALNLYFFYLPLMVCGIVNTIIPAVMMKEENPNVNTIVTAVSMLATILTSLQMKVCWGSESTNCDEAFKLYQQMEAEVSYQLLLGQQDADTATLLDFIWATRNKEHKAMSSLPFIPRAIYNKWSKLGGTD